MLRRFNLSEWALAHQTLVLYFMLVLAFVGVGSYLRLGQAEDPDFTFKLMVVRTLWPGASAEEVERQLTDKLEKKLQETPRLDFLRSYSKPGESVVFVFVKDSSRPDEIKDTWYQVRKKVGDIRLTLPQGIVGPFFNDEFGDTFGNIYALTGDGYTYAQLKETADRIRNELLRVKDVAKVDLIGEQDEKIYVELANAKLATLGRGPVGGLRGAGAAERGSGHGQLRDAHRSHLHPRHGRARFRREREGDRDPRQRPPLPAWATSPTSIAASSIRRSRACATWGARPSASRSPWCRAATSSRSARRSTCRSIASSTNCPWASSSRG